MRISTIDLTPSETHGNMRTFNMTNGVSASTLPFTPEAARTAFARAAFVVVISIISILLLSGGG